MTIQQVFQIAVEHHRAGRLAEAEQLYRAILAQQPHHADAMYALGALAHQFGSLPEAREWIHKAVVIQPSAQYYFGLAEVLKLMGDRHGAIDALRQAIAMKPEWAALYSNLGDLLQSQNQVDEAVAAFQKAVSLAPNDAMFLNNLGHALQAAGKLEEAVEKFRKALQLQPALSQALGNLVAVLSKLRRFDEACGVLRHQADLHPNDPLIYYSLALTLFRQGRYEESIHILRQALALKPDWPEAYQALSAALHAVKDIDGAMVAAQQAIKHRPGYAMARESLAYALQIKGELDQSAAILSDLIAEFPGKGQAIAMYANVLRMDGRLEESLEGFRRAAELNPDDINPACSYLFTMLFHVDDAAILLDEHRKWDAHYAAPLRGEILPLHINRDPHRRLRIGYVSPDFRHHCQALFTSALLPHHDREQFEIYIYSSVTHDDVVTKRLRKYADVWRQVVARPDAEVADLIRADGIDILVDLTMHMGDGRPLLFARKPAPVQVAWLAYPGSTGLSTMDYRLTDPNLDPPGYDDRYTEKSIRLPETFWCYDPRGMVLSDDEPLPEPNELPALKNGYFTFGCLNEFFKVNAATIERWGRLMQGVKRSRLRLLAGRGQCRERVRAQLKIFNIDADRIDFIDRQSRAAYLAEYHRIDLCLDTLPYNGHTTSLDAFWMGVPVLTQVGGVVVGRAGLSQLMNLQLTGFVAETSEQFIAMGQEWAGNLPKLAEIRSTLRERMTASPLMDSAKFTRGMEAAFRQMWLKWVSA